MSILCKCTLSHCVPHLSPSHTHMHTHTHTLDVSESFLPFKVDVYSCCNYRHDLGKDYAVTVKKSIQAVLLDLLTGYNGGRSHYTH